MSVLELRSIVKDYHGLRPLRIAGLLVAEGERVAVAGLDAVAAEVLTTLVTGAAVPDEGVVTAFGQDTAAIADADSWLAGLDRFGLLTDRVVLLEGLTVEQNIALSLTLELDALPPSVKEAVTALAAEVGLSAERLRQSPAEISPSDRFRLRLARAVASGARLLVAEHPTAAVPRADIRSLASLLVRVAGLHRAAVLLLTDDTEFSEVVADRRFELDGATGALRPARRRGWFA